MLTKFRSPTRVWPVILISIALLGVLDTATAGSADRVVTERDLAALAWRPAGPANMGGRVAALAMVPNSRTDFYVGFATGGLFKTSNQGTTFQEVFRHEATSSIGAVAVAHAPQDWTGWDAMAADGDSLSAEERDKQGRGRFVWVGTGEGNGRNSVSWGHGVYLSTDAGASFEHKGLAATHNIPRLAVDPTDPLTCYVAALGHLWGPNDERGVYRTRDGGDSWQQVLRVNEHVGACDVVLDPRDHSVVYAAMYGPRRTAWSFHGFSSDGGIFRSEDGGDSWQKLSEGLPTRTGRIGLAVFAENPDILYAVVESDQGGTGTGPWDDHSPAGGLFRSDDRGDTWRRINQINPRPFYFSRVAIDPEDADRVYLLGWDVMVSDDGGVNFRRSGSTEVHVDHHAIVIDPDDPQRILLGNDGGVYVSYDRTATWDFLDHLDVGQFYHVAVDNADPYRIGGGLQDNGSWIGPSETFFNSGSGGEPGILNEDWSVVYGGDGFRVAFDPEDENIVYATSQGGHLSRIHLDTNLRRTLRAGAEEGQTKLRFNWDAPFLISAHDASVLYHAGNRVFKLRERGEHWYPISEDLSRREVDKIMTEGSQAETYGTVTALTESPREAGILWAGTDDGLIHLTKDDGDAWQDVTPKQVRGRYVSYLEASHHDDGTVYAAIDGHRSDDFSALVLMGTDAGRKWRDISGDLPPDSPVRVVREDPANGDVLYCGTEQAVYVTLDRGQRWLKLGGKSLPTVPVYDLALQMREGDLVAGTHGRSIWILEGMGTLAGLKAVADETVHLFPVADVTPALYGFRGYGGGNRVYKAGHPRRGAIATYWLDDVPESKVNIVVKDAADQVIRNLAGKERPGLNRVSWDLQADPKHRFNNPSRAGPVFVEPGLYKIVVTVGEATSEAEFTVHPYPGWIDPQEKARLPEAGPGLSPDP